MEISKFSSHILWLTTMQFSLTFRQEMAGTLTIEVKRYTKEIIYSESHLISRAAIQALIASDELDNCIIDWSRYAVEKISVKMSQR